VLRQWGGLQVQMGDLKAATQTLYETAWMAEATNQDALAADAWIALCGIVGNNQKKPEEGRRLAGQAAAFIERLGGDKELEGRLSEQLGLIAWSEGHAEQALAHHQKALALLTEALGPEHPSLASILMNIGRDLENLGRYKEALSVSERALAIFEGSLGPSHPNVANALFGLADIHFHLGHYEQSLTLHERSVAILEALFGPEYRGLSVSLERMGRALFARGGYAGAEAQSKRGLATLGRQADDNRAAVQRAGLLTAVGELLRAQRRFDEALDRDRRALAIYERVLGPEHVMVGWTLTSTA